MEEGYGVDIIYIDYRKAFDTVHHGRLMNKLKSYGVDGRVTSWVNKVLSQRRMRVEVQGHFRMGRCTQLCTSRLCVLPSTLSDFRE